MLIFAFYKYFTIFVKDLAQILELFDEFADSEHKALRANYSSSPVIFYKLSMIKV